MISDTGVDGTGWGWYQNITAASLADEMAANDMRILAYEMRAPRRRLDAVDG